MTMTKRDIGKEIVQGLKKAKKGRIRLQTFTVDLPQAANVPANREELGLSQEQFAQFMSVSGDALIEGLNQFEPGFRLEREQSPRQQRRAKIK